MSLSQLSVPDEESRQRSRSPHQERKNKKAENEKLLNDAEWKPQRSPEEKWLNDAEWTPQRSPVREYPDHYRVPCGGDLEEFIVKEGSVM